MDKKTPGTEYPAAVPREGTPPIEAEATFLLLPPSLGTINVKEKRIFVKRKNKKQTKKSLPCGRAGVAGLNLIIIPPYTVNIARSTNPVKLFLKKNEKYP